MVTAKQTHATAEDVREYARNHGYTVGSRGRLSRELIDEFNQGRKPAQRYPK